MSEPVQPTRIRRLFPKRAVVLVLAVTAIGVCGWPMVDAVLDARVVYRLRSPDPEQRIKACQQIVSRRITWAADELIRRVATESDRRVLELVGYALMRTGDVRNGSVRVLLQRAAEDSDDRVRAKLLTYAARLSRRHPGLSPLLNAVAADSGQPWRQVGAAAALLEAGHLQGGVQLIQLAQSDHSDVADYAFAELQRIAEVMCQSVGFSVSWPADAPLTPLAAEQLQTFWKTYATTQLLGDALNRLEERDDRWHQTNRLIHARKRISEWLF